MFYAEVGAEDRMTVDVIKGARDFLERIVSVILQMKEETIVAIGRGCRAAGMGRRQAEASVGIEYPRFHCGSIPLAGNMAAEELDTHIVVVVGFAVLPVVIVD